MFDVFIVPVLEYLWQTTRDRPALMTVVWSVLLLTIGVVSVLTFGWIA